MAAKNTKLKSKWIDFNKIFSYVWLYCFIVSSRGDGKSYGSKLKAIKNYLKHGKQFILIRRYFTEFEDIDKFFDDIIENNEFPDHQFYVKGNAFYCDGEEIGYYYSLTQSLQLKSTPFPKVKLIIFEEFIIPKGGRTSYLKNEVFLFLEIYNTISRLRDVQVIFNANSISKINPYFTYFKIYPVKDKPFICKNDVLLHYHVSDEYIKEVEQTRFGKMIANTDYGKYAIKNEFYDDNIDFIEKKSTNAKLNIIIKIEGKNIGFWFDYKSGMIYSSSKVNLNLKNKFVLYKEELTEGYMILGNYKRNMYINQIIESFRNGWLYYESLEIKDFTYSIMTKFNV